MISTSTEPNPRCAVAIGTDALDLAKYAEKLTHLEAGHNYSFEKLFSEVRTHLIRLVQTLLNYMKPTLNSFASLPWPTRRTVREKIQEDLRNGDVPGSCLVPLKDVKNHLPMHIGGYTDYYTSLEHCQNVRCLPLEIIR